MCLCMKCGCFSCKSSSGSGSGEEKKRGSCPGDFLDTVLAVVLPPAAVYRKEGCSGKFWGNIFLTALGLVPGSIHATIVISSN